MISGPVFPRTRVGLTELFVRHAEQFERGLEVLATNVTLDTDWVVDGLARDAAGGPVLVFWAGSDSGHDLTARVLWARSWAATGVPLLERAVPGAQFERDALLRVLVMGYELAEVIVQQLASLSDVQIYQVQTVQLGGRLTVGLVPLHGSAADEEDSFRLPTGLQDPAARTLGACFLNVMQKLDPNLVIRGDRYSRSLRLGDQVLADLCWHRRALQVHLPGHDDAVDGHAPRIMVLDSEAACFVAADQALRRYWSLLGHGGHEPAPAGEPGVALALSDSGNGCSGDTSVAMDRLRRSVLTSQVSPEEYSVLGGSDPDNQSDATERSRQ